MLKKVLLNLLKASVAAGLLWWLTHSGKLNWDVVADVRRYPLRLLLAFSFCFCSLFLCTWRWRYLLSARATHPQPLLGLFFVNWIGMFFSSVLPGSVTGDVVKIFYVRKRDETFSLPFLLFSCFLDRLMGVTGLVLLMGFFSVLNYSTLIQLSPKLAPLLLFNFLLLAAVIAGLTAFFFFPGVVRRALAEVKRLLPKLKLLDRVLDLWNDLIAARSQMVWAILLSILVQFFGVVIFYVLVSPQFVTNLSLDLVLSFIPLGFMAVAIPIAPGGLGVGHAAFESLFAIAGEPNGANFFNMYFLVVMLFNLLGFVPWLALRRPSK
jgi:uncharacterized protein (TIRG00374 family)